MKNQQQDINNWKGLRHEVRNLEKKLKIFFFKNTKKNLLGAFFFEVMSIKGSQLSRWQLKEFIKKSKTEFGIHWSFEKIQNYLSLDVVSRIILKKEVLDL